MADSIGLTEIKRLARLFGQTWAEAKDDPLGSSLRYLRGASRAAGEALEPAGKVVPVLGTASAGLRTLGDPRTYEPKGSVMGEDSLPSMRADSAADQMGYEQGIPTPSSGGGTAARQVFKRVYDPEKIAVYRRLRSSGASVEDIWKQTQIAQWKPGEYYTEVPGELLQKAQWGPGQTHSTVGELFDWPELAREMDKHSSLPFEDVRVSRGKGKGGSNTLFAPPPNNRAMLGRMKIGDTEMANTFAHESNHALEGMQTGNMPGSSMILAWNDLLKGDGGFRAEAQRLGLLSYADAEAALHTASKGERQTISALMDMTYLEYLKHAGELRARVAGVRDTTLTEAERRAKYPFAETSTPEGARYFTFDDDRAKQWAEGMGENMLENRHRPPSPYAEGSGIDAFFTKPKGVKDKIEDLLAGYAAEQASR